MSANLKSKIGTQDWFYHAPTRPTKEADSNQLNYSPSISQIPGLSSQEEQGEDENTTCRRKWIRETDTDYVKLAKSGGRKDIFTYREARRPASPVPYPRVDWFDDGVDRMGDEKPNPSGQHFNTPEWYGHEEHIKSHEDVSLENKRPLLGYDGLTTWNRANSNDDYRGKGRKGKSRSAPEPKKQLKLPPINQKTLDGDMGSLLSFKYQSDFIQEMNEKNMARKKDLLEERQMAKEKIYKERELFKMKKKPVKVETNKPLFKLSRFDNVSSKVVSYR